MFGTEITNEDVFNFALYQTLPIDKIENKVLRISEIDGETNYEVIPNSYKESTENYQNFINYMGFSGEQKNKLDSILESYQPEPELLQQLGLDPEEHKETLLYRGKGCDHCSGTGYRGRVALYEVLQMDEHLNKCVIKGMPSSEIKKEARKSGMLSLRDSGICKVLTGYTTIEEVLSATFEN